MSTRRAFLKTIGAAFVYSKSELSALAAAGPPRDIPTDAPKEKDIQLPAGGKMPMRVLGRTGVEVSLIGIGGYHLGIPEENEAIRIIQYAQDHGVTFFDNCWDYNGGRSEERLGRALATGGRRQKAFVMTKLDGRTKQSAAGQLEQSLKRLKTDMIDLVQIHEVIRMSDADRVFSPGGAVDALVEAKKQGKLRFIGFTGHKDPAIHLHMLETAKKNNFDFDTVQMPINVLDAHYKSFEHQVLPVLRERNIGVLGMKPLGSGIILQSGVVKAEECLRYAMSAPTSVVITGCDTMGVLKQALLLAMTFKPFIDEERKSLLARTARAAKDGRFEQFKTTERFDGTTANPKWLDTAQI